MVKLEELNSILLLLGVPDNSASQLYLSSCDAQLSTLVPISLTRHMHRIQITNQDLKVNNNNNNNNVVTGRRTSLNAPQKKKLN